MDIQRRSMKMLSMVLPLLSIDKEMSLTVTASVDMLLVNLLP